MGKLTDTELEQQILLGGKISNKHKQFLVWAMQDPDLAFVMWYLDKEKEWLKHNTPEEQQTRETLEVLAQLEFLKNTSELTKLSMIIGDPARSINVRKEMDELRLKEKGTL